MTAGNGGSVQAYNVQLAVSDDHVIIACQAHQSASDQDSFEPMVTAVVDAAQALEDLDGGHRQTSVGLLLADAGYLSEHNLTLPGPNRLIATGKSRDLHQETPCDDPAPSVARPIDQMRHAFADPDTQQRYKRRGATVEPVNAHLKHGVGLQRFSRRGVSSVTAELNLAAAVVNLQRLYHRGRATS
ncbi:MAG: transposase [Micrococcales bacterium]|nr:transposase [Micrococcales bacterium]